MCEWQFACCHLGLLLLKSWKHFVPRLSWHKTGDCVKVFVSKQPDGSTRSACEKKNWKTYLESFAHGITISTGSHYTYYNYFVFVMMNTMSQKFRLKNQFFKWFVSGCIWFEMLFPLHELDECCVLMWINKDRPFRSRNRI